jgi:alginate O-acetyltransferase complex protein AlgI
LRCILFGHIAERSPGASVVFNSITFLIFLAITLSLYYRLGHKGQNWLLLAASYIFYGWWDYRFAFLLLATSLLDWALAIWMDRSETQSRRKFFLTLSIVSNMGVLCLFKYFNFFADSLERLLTGLGINASFPILHVILPIGISFYTFLSMSYTIDVYRREIKASQSPVDFLLYVAFFPHLVAGPIVRASYLLPQCQAPRVIKNDQVANGIWLILVGFVKKIVIADRLAPVVNWGFSQPFPPLTDANAWLIIYAFAFQIYGDFSGYSDIARGLAKIMGFELVENFRAPYLVANPSAFWRNWHISLSTWLRDYLYIPLGGNRRGSFLTYRNLMTTMILGGLWHGAGAAYLLWGIYHGALLSIHRWWLEKFAPIQKTRAVNAAVVGLIARPMPIYRGVLVVLFFHVTCVGWLLFRAGSIDPQFSQVSLVRDFLKAMFSFQISGINPIAQGIFILAGLSLFLQWKHELMDRFASWPLRGQVGAVCAALILIAGLGIFEGSEFIYFAF